MLRWLSHLDRLLRGETTRPDSIRDGTLQVEARGLTLLIVLLGALYGLCMGSYSLLKEIGPDVVDPNGRYMQLLATTIKVPALFFLTLIVTFPSLYVFNALVGSRLRIASLLRLLIASLAVNLAVLSSLGPIVLFFSLSTKSYAFIQLLNVAAFSVAGVFGLIFLLQTLHRLTMPVTPTPKEPQSDIDVAEPEEGNDNSTAASNSDVDNESNGDDSSPLDMPAGQALGRHTRLVFGCWVVVFSVVGAQMGWVLRPFIGNPHEPFSWFRERQSNFFEAVLKALGAILFGGG